LENSQGVRAGERDAASGVHDEPVASLLEQGPARFHEDAVEEEVAGTKGDRAHVVPRR